MLLNLNIQLPDKSFDDTVEALESLEVGLPPRPIEGVHGALAEISREFPLAIVSDTINASGTGLLHRNLSDECLH